MYYIEISSVTVTTIAETIPTNRQLVVSTLLHSCRNLQFAELIFESTELSQLLAVKKVVVLLRIS
jgi:hypothetical protein